MSESQQAADEVKKLVGQAINRIAEQQAAAAAPPPPPGQARQRATLVGLCLAAPVLLGILAFNLAGPAIAERLATRPPPPVARQNADQTLRTLVAEIEAFREDYSELPQTIHEVGAPPQGTWRYEVVSSTGYRIHGSLQGQDVSFDSSRGAGQ